MANTKKIQATFLLTGLFFLLTISGYFVFLKSSYFDIFYTWSQQNLVVYCLVLFLLKICAIVYAPLPGGLLSLGSIPVLGWKLTYIVDFFGSLVGGSIAYYLGKKYGLAVMRRVFDEQTIEKVQQFKMNKDREIEGIFVLRVLTGSSLMDAICYAAGLLRVKYRHFLIGSVLSHLVVGIPAFYLADNILSFNVQNVLLNLLGLIIPLAIVYQLRHRYFSRENSSDSG